MFDDNTVIVLGAGASVQFGFPLGAELYGQIFSELNQLSSAAKKGSPFSSRDYLAHRQIELFDKMPVRALAQYLSMPSSQQHLPHDQQHDKLYQQLLDLPDRLRQNTQDTIDVFLNDNPSFRFVGKALLSSLIFLKMYELDEENGSLILKSFSDREYGERRNWYHQLIGRIRHGASNGASLKSNKLTVITFNYDHSLEQALETSLTNTERHTGVDYRNVVKILHVNGTVPAFPFMIKDAGKFVLQSARDFVLIDEDAGSKIQKQRMEARQAIKEAKTAYVMGFHFDPSNISAIGLNHSQKNSTYCLNFDGNLAVNREIAQLGIRQSQISSGTSSSKLHIDTALANGFIQR